MKNDTYPFWIEYVHVMSALEFHDALDVLVSSLSDDVLTKRKAFDVVDSYYFSHTDDNLKMKRC